MELKEYWPRYLQDLIEFDQIASAEQPEFQEAMQDVQGASNDFFLDSLTDYGCQRWETILNLPKIYNNTLEERRFRIMTWLNRQAPFTMTTLCQQLSSLCGEGEYTVELNAENYLLIVRISITSKNNFDDIEIMLHSIVPANIVIDFDLMRNTHQMISRYTHTELSLHNHDQIRNEVFL
ncbi:putative phage tail protein [Anaeromassilibacillus senegalensis]|uniref:putative phage tail protein n=1 Tax=Anaeromassilibacillus senegalensis TaxID=1673717 RepID=UPI00068242A7|nr:putative phage tail protein [Anaeromassilibacillus senegalensis]